MFKDRCLQYLIYVSSIYGYRLKPLNLLCLLQEVLDADDNPLKNKYGEVMDRDIVQFVPLRKVGANLSLVISVP